MPQALPPNILSVIPFVGLLLCIAILPVLPRTARWWHSNLNRLLAALVAAAATVICYAFTLGGGRVITLLSHAVLQDYIPFIVLLFSLYVIGGGISLSGDFPAHPSTNTAFLAVGTVIASLIGTTGASMLLIRPLLQTNSERKHVRHTVIFFIFLVSNIGGCLLPLGDPPLFLGYLRGVPFLWTLGLWKEWAFSSTILLVIYYLWDRRAYRRESNTAIALDEAIRVPLKLRGGFNLLLLAVVVACVAMITPGPTIPDASSRAFPYTRELIMLIITATSFLLTPRAVRAANRFNYHAIIEVAVLFLGIFICVQAPIEILHASGNTLTPYLHSPAAFFWGTGTLSSFLDNAPTYVVFFETAVTLTPDHAIGALSLPGGSAIMPSTLAAISLGAVFMGANTYIGNGPNFMVRTIAEQEGVKMPGFFGYMLYSIGILVPLFALVTLLFLR